jgi:hypothetical protein
MRGVGEERTEPYKRYGEGVPQAAAAGRAEPADERWTLEPATKQTAGIVDSLTTLCRR